MFIKARIILLSLLAVATSINAREMPRSLREAERLYANQRYSEASDKAKEFQKLFPSNVQALIILGMSDYNLNNYKDSVKWFKKAIHLSPNHPIASKYLTLLQELEYRSGPFSIEPSEADFSDPKVSAEFYKRGYFNTAYPKESEKSSPRTTGKPLEPVLIKQPLPPSTYRANSKVALDSNEKFSESTSTAAFMEKMAREALEDKRYIKAYLFYSQLSAGDPNNRTFRIEQAEAAFHLGRYAKVVELLLPITSKDNLDSLTNHQREKVINLLNKAASKSSK